MFPDGWPGFALLLLRGVVGLTIVVQGVEYLDNWLAVTFKTAIVATFLVASGVCLIVGLLTPIACLFTALGSIGLVLSWLPTPPEIVFAESLLFVDMIVMIIVIAVLGPGAFSVDSRMFGRREILIPSPPHSQGS